jgi:hypothetical protein
MNKYSITLLAILIAAVGYSVSIRMPSNQLSSGASQPKVIDKSGNGSALDYLLLLEQESGLSSIIRDGGDLATFDFVGWSDQWKWDQPVANEDQTTSIRKLRYAKQNVNLTVTSRTIINGIEYTLKLDYLEPLKTTIGGAVEFEVSDLTKNLAMGAEPPVLLAENRGWSWQFSDSSTLQVEFNPPLPKIHFERGQRNRIRAWLFDKEIQIGSQTYTMKLTLPKHDYVSFDKDSAAKIAELDLQNGWVRRPRFGFENSVDLSHLNHKPAGKFGFVKAKGEKLVFSNEQPIRFFGVNIQGSSLFIQDREIITSQAKTLAKLGVNLVRLHHHDSARWVKDSLIKNTDTTQEINRKSLDTYHWWVKSLKDQGIYVWIDLQVERPWKSGDSLPGWSTDFDIKKNIASGKGLMYLNPRMIDLSKRFNEKLLLTKNPYTGLTLVDDPAIMGVMITNENDLTFHFGNLLNNKEKSPYHRKLFQKQLRQFSDRTPFSKRQLNKTWEPGPSKLLLNDIEAKFNLTMVEHLRSIGLKVPISTTSLWGKGHSLYSIPSLATGDIVDTHGYAGLNPLKANPNFEPSIVGSLAYAQVAGKPFTVSEYNSDETSITDTSHQILPFISAHAAFQGWDAIILYGYSQDGFSKTSLSPWSSYLNPSIIDLLPASALLYRQRHISESLKPHVIGELGKRIFNEDISPATSVAIRSLSEQNQLKISLPANPFLTWLQPSPYFADTELIQDLDNNYLDSSQNSVVSDTGELSRSWTSGEFTINTPKSQGSINSKANSKINLNTFSYTLLEQGSSVIFSSLDGDALEISERILLTTANRVRSRGKGKHLVVLTKPTGGSFVFTSKLPKVTLRRLNGSLPGEVEVVSVKLGAEHQHSFSLPMNGKTTMYILSKKKN